MLLAVPRAHAHDIPRDVTVRAFAKPEGATLRLVVRVPLKSIADIEYPRRERDYVDLARVDQALRDAARLYVGDQIDIYEGDTLLDRPRIVATRMSLESDRSFTTYDDAVAHITGPPLAAGESIFWEQGLLDVLFEYPIQSDRSNFSIDARFDRLALRVVTALRFLPPGGAIRAFELEGNSGLVRLDPRWYQAAFRFVELGVNHILSGADHLLFLFCLVVPFRRVRGLIPVITAFTIAHSITLLASAYGYAPDVQWFPPLVETLIAASIFYMAIENIASPGAAALKRRWVVAFGFGLVHGFGFAFGLQHTLQFAGSHLAMSLVSFNVGVEIGQLLVLMVLVPLLDLTFRYLVAERMGTIVLSAIVAHTAWHWTGERFDVLRQYPWPTVTTAGLVSAMRWAMLAVAVAGVYGLWRGRAKLLPRRAQALVVLLAVLLGATLRAQDAPAPELGWVVIPPGTFEMGCVAGDTSCGDDEQSHPVTISQPFEMMAAEVTVGQFRVFTDATGRKPPAPARFMQADDHPVVNVSWDDADAFCGWAGGRLPSEAAWEYAARGGEKARIYPWGNQPSHDQANYGADECCSGLASGRDRWEHTAPVRSFPPNGYGLFDTTGNVWEWVADWYAPYEQGHATDPTGPRNGPLHLVRGGSWLNVPAGLRSSIRLPFSGLISNVGFRCARNAVGVRMASRF